MLSLTFFQLFSEVFKTFNHLADCLQILAVCFVEGVQFLAVNIKYRHHLAVVAKHGYDDFRLRLAAARYMARELLNVRHNDGLCFLPGSATHTLAEGDVHTCNRALEWAKHQFSDFKARVWRAIAGHHAIESCPPESHRLMDYRCYIAHDGYRVLLAFNECFNLADQYLIFFFFHILPTWWQHDILHVVSHFEKRRDFVIGESGNTATDASHEERQLRMFLGERDKFIHVGLDSLYPTLHRGDSIALALQAYALAHDGSKLAVGDIGRPTAVHTSKVAAEHKDLIRLQLCNKLWCSTFLLHLVSWLFVMPDSNVDAIELGSYPTNVCLAVVIGEHNLWFDDLRSLNQLVWCHGIGLVARQESDVYVLNS